jgi:phenylacetate-CoA ligase
MEPNLVEFVSGGKPVAPGQEGEMLITDLTNPAVPLIRYQINDYGIPLAETCACGRGSFMMSKAIGRLTDDIYSPEGVRHSGHVLGYALAESGPMIGQIQVLQESLTRFLVRLTNKPAPRQEDFDYISGVFERLLGDGVEVIFEIVDNIPKEKSGKVRFVKCLLDTETRARLSHPRRERIEDPGHR